AHWHRRRPRTATEFPSRWGPGSRAIARTAGQASDKTDQIAAVVEFFVIDRLLAFGVGNALDQKDGTAGIDGEGLRHPGSGDDGFKSIFRLRQRQVIFVFE